MTADRAGSLRALASLLRGGLTVRTALRAWAEESARPEVAVISRRAALGIPLGEVASDTSHEQDLGLGLRLYTVTGLDLSRWLERMASSVERSEASEADARAAVSGATLSGRMVALLPLLFIPLTPMARAPVLDAVGVLLLGAGVALALVGLRWMKRLVPRCPQPDPVAEACAAVAAGLEAGMPLRSALRAAAAVGGERWTSAARLASLGMTWPDALRAADPGLENVARVLDRCGRSGLPPARTLGSLEEQLRREAARSFEQRVRRAPVLMVIPLTCCVLPAFGLLALAPFLRGIAMG